MNDTFVGAVSALTGSLVGGLTSVITAWFAQSAQTKRDFLGTEIRKRETLYGEFVTECTRLLIDSLDHTLEKPEIMLNVVAILNRIRLVASPAVIEAGEAAVHSILQNYIGENIPVEEFRKRLKDGTFNLHDPLSAFSRAGKAELKMVHLHVHRSV